MTDLSEVGLDEVIVALETKRDRLRAEADKVEEAIATLRKLQNRFVEDIPAPTAAPAPGPVAAPRPAPVSHKRVHENRPTKGTCGRAACGKSITVAGTGRLRRFCGPACGRLARKELEQVPAAPAAVPVLPTVVTAAPEPIPESASGMKARIAQALRSTSGEMPRSSFLATVRGRNDEAARRAQARRA